MKVGLKLYSCDSPELIKERDFADFLEVLVVPGFSVDFLKDYDFEYTIHAPHVLHKVNLASKQDQEYSVNATREAIAAADILNSKIIVTHPGFRHTPKDTPAESVEIMRESLTLLDDRRIVLENVPMFEDWNIGAIYYLAYDSASVKKFADLVGSQTCLDFAHAIVSAAQLKKDPLALIRGMMKYDIKTFHLCDGIMAQPIDQHLPLFKGDYDLAYLKQLISKSDCQRVVLETGMHPENFRSEYDWLKK